MGVFRFQRIYGYGDGYGDNGLNGYGYGYGYGYNGLNGYGYGYNDLGSATGMAWEGK